MIYKYTSVKRVLSKVFSDLNLMESTNRISDMIEWAGEGLEKIGAFPQFDIKVTGRDDLPLLVLTNYQCKLPLGFHGMIQVGYSEFSNGPFSPMRRATGSFDTAPAMAPELLSTTEILPDNDLVIVAMDVYNITYTEALVKLNNEPETKALLTGMLTSKRMGPPQRINGGQINTLDYTYVIQGDYIKCNMASGYLQMAYQCIPLDGDGYPLIPDNQSYIEALYWYITMKLLYSDWKNGLVRDAVYYDAKRSWNYYCKQAYGTALMPDVDQLESIKNSWVRLIPNINEHSTFFTALGEQQQVYNQNHTYSNNYYYAIK
jgi:hypothetical protein